MKTPLALEAFCPVAGQWVPASETGYRAAVPLYGDRLGAVDENCPQGRSDDAASYRLKCLDF